MCVGLCAKISSIRAESTAGRIKPRELNVTCCHLANKTRHTPAVRTDRAREKDNICRIDRWQWSTKCELLRKRRICGQFFGLLIGFDRAVQQRSLYRQVGLFGGLYGVTEYFSSPLHIKRRNTVREMLSTPPSETVFRLRRPVYRSGTVLLPLY